MAGLSDLRTPAGRFPAAHLPAAPPERDSDSLTIPTSFRGDGRANPLLSGAMLAERFEVVFPEELGIREKPTAARVTIGDERSGLHNPVFAGPMPPSSRSAAPTNTRASCNPARAPPCSSIPATCFANVIDGRQQLEAAEDIDPLRSFLGSL